MIMKHISKCIICGKKYEYCGHCAKENTRNMWRNLYCSENCRNIYDICGKCVAKTIKADEAYNRLSRLDTSKPIMLDGVRGNVVEIKNYGKSAMRGNNAVKDYNESLHEQADFPTYDDDNRSVQESFRRKRYTKNNQE